MRDPGDHLGSLCLQLAELGLEPGEALGRDLDRVAAAFRGDPCAASAAADATAPAPGPAPAARPRRAPSRAPSASPSGSATIRVGAGAAGGAAGSGRSDPVRPVALRSPVAWRRFANGRTTSRSGRAARSASGIPAANSASSASSYSSTAGVAAHQTRVPAGSGQGVQPVAARIRPAVAEGGGRDRGDPPADRGLGRADVQDRLRGEPERREPGRHGLRGRPLAIEPEVGTRSTHLPMVASSIGAVAEVPRAR